ncbi:MAG: hypothetical protein ACUVWJ_11585 [Spirochaetota bacterium]
MLCIYFRKGLTSTIVFLFVLFLATFGTIFFDTGAADNDPLWEKAVEIASLNENWVPGYVIHNEAVYSKLGIRIENTETHSNLRKLQDGKVEVIFLKVLQNSRDITEQFKKEIGERIILEEDEYKVEHPFRSFLQQNVSFKRLNKRKVINRKNCVLYEFTYRNEQGTWQGVAWLEEKTGTPVLVQGRLITVPFKDEWCTISGLETTISFYSNNGDWYPESSIIDSIVEIGDNPSDVYKGRVKETYEFRDYWRKR